jgi:hypothetical protein
MVGILGNVTKTQTALTSTASYADSSDSKVTHLSAYADSLSSYNYQYVRNKTKVRIIYSSCKGYIIVSLCYNKICTYIVSRNVFEFNSNSSPLPSFSDSSFLIINQRALALSLLTVDAVSVPRLSGTSVLCLLLLSILLMYNTILQLMAYFNQSYSSLNC